MRQNNILNSDLSNITEAEKADILKRFMKEHFPFGAMRKAGLFTKEMKNDYQAQADRICTFFGYKTIYEYGATEIRCHISYIGERPKDEPFITVIPSIYE